MAKIKEWILSHVIECYYNELECVYGVPIKHYRIHFR